MGEGDRGLPAVDARCPSLRDWPTTMADGQRPYLEPDDGEIDCAYFVGESEYISGFLRLPNPSDVGRVRFLEDVPDLASNRSPSLGPVAVTLLDEKGGGTDACLLNSFVTS